MVDSTGTAPAGERRTERLELRVPTSRTQLPAVRAMTGDLAMRMDFDLDAVEDLRLAVDEASATLAAIASPGAPLVVVFEVGAAGLGIHAWVPGAACSLDCPSWSVSVEVFFYALFPILLPLTLRDPARVGVATLAFWTASVALCTLLWQAYGAGVPFSAPEPGGVGPVLLAQFIKYFPVLHLPTFVAGLLLFAFWERSRWPVGLLLAGASAFAILIVVLAPVFPGPILHNGMTMAAWAPLILACAAMRRGPLCTAPMIFLGKISFALYLLHIPVFAVLNTVDRVALHGWLMGHPWVGVAVNGLVSLAAASLVHLVVEEPARRWILRRGAPPIRGPVATA